MVAFSRSAMKTLRLQLSELDDDFFLLSQGEEGEMHEVAQEEGEMHEVAQEEGEMHEMAHEGEMHEVAQEEGEMHEMAHEGEMHEMAHEGEMRQTEQGNAGKRHVNRTNFVIKCLEVGPVSVRFT